MKRGNEMPDLQKYTLILWLIIDNIELRVFNLNNGAFKLQIGEKLSCALDLCKQSWEL